MRPRDFRRVCVMGAGIVLLTFTSPLVPASAVASPDVRTPHLDQVERTLGEVAPGLRIRQGGQGYQTWQRTEGNRLGPDPWILQVPDCWGDATCVGKPGIARLLAKTTADISRARHSVDIATLGGDGHRLPVWPSGAFEDAIVAGLKNAVRALPSGSPPITLRFLSGAIPWPYPKDPAVHVADLERELGPDASRVDITVASMDTSYKAHLVPDSWNHAKLMVVDRESAITGGVNYWSKPYIDTASPVVDLDIALEGPAAGSAGRFLDSMWDWTCDNAGGITAKAWVASSSPRPCPRSVTGTPEPEPPGNLPVISVGDLGIGVLDRDPRSHYRLPPAQGIPDVQCLDLHDYTNNDRDYATTNPGQAGQRALVASARHSIVISQEDLLGGCDTFPSPEFQPRYDVRLLDTLAAKMVSGVKLRVVISTPGGNGGYTHMTSMRELVDALSLRTALAFGADTPANRAKAERVMRHTLQLASVRNDAGPRWPNQVDYTLHTKLIMVDDAAFYIGSRNAYPASLQEHGFFVEDRDAAAQLNARLLDKEWAHSCAGAVYDWDRAHCRRPGS